MTWSGTALRRRLPLALAAAVAACAAPRRAAPPVPERIEFTDPLVVEATRLDVELSGKNDEELFAVGTAAFAAGELRRAAAAFARVADLFPDSPHRAAAFFNAGLSYERLEEWRLALERFRAVEAGRQGPDAVEASFRVAECLWHLGELAAARATLDRLAGRTDLEAGDRVRALAWRGVVELESSEPDAAESSLRLAVAAFGAAADRERLDGYYAAQAQYYLGEVYRGRFQAVRLDPSRDGEVELEAGLVRKAELLLSAQGHYLRAIRQGSPDWSVAAGYRIGELYDELHGQLTEAPLPSGLDEEQQAAYRAELRKKVRVLLVKALEIYERTLAGARRAGVDNRFVEKTQASLDRMKRTLLSAGGEPAAGGPPAPPDADPDAAPDPSAGP